MERVLGATNAASAEALAAQTSAAEAAVAAVTSASQAIAAATDGLTQISTNIETTVENQNAVRRGLRLSVVTSRVESGGGELRARGKLRCESLLVLFCFVAGFGLFVVHFILIDVLELLGAGPRERTR